MQPMRAAQKSDPDLYADSAPSAVTSTTTAGESMRDPSDSQVVERVIPDNVPPSFPPALVSSMPFIAVDSSSSHPVHVNTGAFGTPAIVIEDSSASNREMFIAGGVAATISSAESVSAIGPVVSKGAAHRTLPLAIVAVAALTTVAATAAWWFAHP
jgi:hypothetical protein